MILPWGIIVPIWPLIDMNLFISYDNVEELLLRHYIMIQTIPFPLKPNSKLNPSIIIKLHYSITLIQVWRYQKDNQKLQGISRFFKYIYIYKKENKFMDTGVLDFFNKKLILDYNFCLKSGPVFLFQIFIIAPLPLTVVLDFFLIKK
jgi:hypothetical protein